MPLRRTSGRGWAAACWISRRRSFPYLALSVLMYLVVDVSYLVVLAVALPASGFLLRTYIVFHDCAHGSLLPAKRAKVWLGSRLGAAVASPLADQR
jgi:acyl-lipid omega-6 desaturase (Delta-12 desaturase)